MKVNKKFNYTLLAVYFVVYVAFCAGLFYITSGYSEEYTAMLQKTAKGRSLLWQSIKPNQEDR